MPRSWTEDFWWQMSERMARGIDDWTAPAREEDRYEVRYFSLGPGVLPTGHPTPPTLPERRGARPLTATEIRASEVWWRAPHWVDFIDTAVQYERTKEEDMTRQEFMKIAEVLKAQRPDPKHATIGEQRVWALVVRGLAGMLANSNPRFDAAVFYEAAGYSGEGL